MESTSSAASALATLWAVVMTSLLPGVNGDALIGAFAGATVFALQAKELGLLKRLVYMLISILIGYMGASEVMTQTGLQSWTIAAFGLSSTVVTLALAGIEKIKTFDISTIFKRGS
ncbi:putative holin [Alcaligenes sp. SDU_A2]|uniref:putative holin n=1 Tax=Alcaligenes sp. SDU_A2 TaxID=3136634 RepID=UPI002BA6C6DA|nr:putative holin [Alcaligenes sp.]